MSKVLIAVDGTRGSRAVASTLGNLVHAPEEVTILHVQRLEGDSLIIDMLGDPELATLKGSLEGTDHQRALDERSGRILEHYRRRIPAGSVAVKTLVRAGRPAEEILRAAREGGADLIILGGGGKGRLDRLITGSVSREVEQRSPVPVLRARVPLMCEEPYSWGDARAAVTVCSAVAAGLFLLGLLVP